MATRIKYCGITRLEDAEHAVSLDAWAVGMILWPDSPRYCKPADAAAIGAALHRRAEVAGVFVNAHLDHVVNRAEEFGLTLVQLHGDEGPSFCTEVARRTGARVVKVARVRNRADVQALRAFRTDYHLLDAYVAGQPGGTGETFAWELVRAHRRDRPVILSGGLTPANVGEAIAAARPYAVDVASGVELAPGIKDHRLMDEFSAAVRAADAAEQQGAAA
jgi:phosphoribosylanthranilate isomerase